MREMKDSGVPWIGEIPKEWTLVRLKRACTLHGRIGWNGLRSDEFQFESDAYLVTGQDFKRSEIDWDNCFQINKERYDEDPFIQLKNGDLLVTKDGTIGKVAIVTNLNKPACLNSGIFVVRQRKSMFDSRFLYWLFYSPLLIMYNDYSNAGGSTIIHLYQNVFERMPLILPSKEEQGRIVNFLNSTCTKIETIINNTRISIEEYKKLKQSVITEAVTKGIRGNRPMKDSGVEWIGNIPMEWHLVRLRFLSQIFTGDQDTQDNNPDGEYPFYVRSPLVEHSNRWTFEGPAILMAGDGAGAGRVFHYVNGKYGCHQRVYSIQHIHGVSRRVLYYYLKEFFYIMIETANSKSTVDSVRLDMLKDFPICIAPEKEQQEIATYLDEKCAAIDSLIASKEALITELETYKKSLIYEYVTGKKEVPESPLA